MKTLQNALDCNAAFCKKALGHCVIGDFSHCRKEHNDVPQNEGKIKMYVRYALTFGETCSKKSGM